MAANPVTVAEAIRGIFELIRWLTPSAAPACMGAGVLLST